jgi:hypothetical protein
MIVGVLNLIALALTLPFFRMTAASDPVTVR